MKGIHIQTLYGCQDGFSNALRQIWMQKSWTSVAVVSERDLKVENTKE